MNVNGLTETLNKFVRNYLRQVHTIKPAQVVSVNHGSNTLTAKIMTDTYKENGVNIPHPDVVDVPFFILSANAGAAKITMPITPGDLVLILFSDRDYENYLLTSGSSLISSKNPATHDYNPLLALPCFYTAGSSTEVSSTDITIQNGSTTVTVAPDGAVTVDSPATVDINATTGVNITSPLTTVNGNMQVNGNIVASGNVTGALITFLTGLTGLGIDYTTHRHDENGDGGGTTDGPRT